MEKAINPRPSRMGPTAHEPRKIGNPVPTEGAKQENQINTRGGINRKTLAEDTNYNKIKIYCYNHYETQSNRQCKKNNVGAGATKTVAALQASQMGPRR